MRRSEPIQQWSQGLPKGKEVECLIDRLKEHYTRTAQPNARAKQRQREMLLSHLPQDVQGKLDEDTLDKAAGILMVRSPGNQSKVVIPVVCGECRLKLLPT